MAGEGGTVCAVIPERLSPLIDTASELAGRFTTAGWSIYLVGGSVRDAILAPATDHTVAATDHTVAATGSVAPIRSQEAHDLDFTTNARPDDIEKLLKGWADAVWLQGKRFGTIACLKDGLRYEITTHRGEVYNPDSRKPEVSFGDSLQEDLARRDFTVNAMALSLPDVQLIDPFGGLGDLATGRLRTPLEPAVSFGDDPLRMLRAARFVAQLGLVPDESLVQAVKEMHGRMAVVSAERVRDELDKLLVAPKASPGLWFMIETGLAEEILPELPALALEQDPVQRHKDVLAHTLAVVDKTTPDRLLRMAALLHDIGKPRTRAFGPGGVSFHNHDMVGARMARKRLVALRYSSEDVETVTRLVELHLRFHTYRMGWTDSAVRRYVRDAGDLLGRLNELTRCDCTTRNPAKARALSKRMDELEVRIAELRAREEIDAIRPDLDGHQVMQHLGIRPGRAVGKALDYLLELRLEEGPLGEEEAFRRLDAWWSTQGTTQSTTGQSTTGQSTTGRRS
jgi:poly(A) polymerase